MIPPPSIRIAGAQRAYTVREVAAAWRIPEADVRALVYSGELAATRIGTRHIRIPEAEVNRYLGRRDERIAEEASA